jgi:DNA-binding CsgD family transcriptional regulator
MSTRLRVLFPATEESKSKSLTPSPRLLFCGPTGSGQQNLDLFSKVDVCAVDVQSAEELSRAVSATAPDLIVLSLEALRRVFANGTSSFNSAEDLEYALLGLRARQADIVRMIAKGLRNREIARSLGLSSRTVKAILSALYLRYDVTNRTELLGLLMEQGHSAAPQLHPMPATEQRAPVSHKQMAVRRPPKGQCA